MSSLFPFIGATAQRVVNQDQAKELEKKKKLSPVFVAPKIPEKKEVVVKSMEFPVSETGKKAIDKQIELAQQESDRPKTLFSSLTTNDFYSLKEKIPSMGEKVRFVSNVNKYNEAQKGTSGSWGAPTESQKLAKEYAYDIAYSGDMTSPLAGTIKKVGGKIIKETAEQVANRLAKEGGEEVATQVSKNLLEEAKKYKSAEEFVSDHTPVFRGGTKLDLTQLEERGLPVTVDKSVAENFAKAKNNFDLSPAGQIMGRKPGQNIVEEYFIPPNIKIATKKDIPESLFKEYKESNPFTHPAKGESILGKWAKQNNFDALSFATLFSLFQRSVSWDLVLRTSGFKIFISASALLVSPNVL